LDLLSGIKYTFLILRCYRRF